MFRIGQKVVCIEDDSFNLDIMDFNQAPKVGEIVTILEIEDNMHLFFKEYQQLDCDGDQSVYDPKCFRPLKLDYNFVEEVIKQVQSKEELA